jgi:hypothetical protein
MVEIKSKMLGRAELIHCKVEFVLLLIERFSLVPSSCSD